MIEPAIGEDCDRPDATCGQPGTATACRLLCDPLIQPDACPAGAACGNDGVCRAPSGRFTKTLDTRWTAPALMVGDTTGDGLPELIGVSDVSIEVRRGAPDATYTSAVVVPNLPVYGEPRLSDLDGDGSSDLTIPVGIGLYSLLGDPFDALQPIFQNTFSLPSQGRLLLSTIDFVSSSGSLQLPDGEMLAAFELPQGPNCAQPGGCGLVSLGDGVAVFPPGKEFDDVYGDHMPWSKLPGGNDAIVAALVFTDDPSTVVVDEGGVFLYTGQPRTETITLRGQITLPGRVRGGAWFADLDGDGRADLINRGGIRLNTGIGTVISFVNTGVTDRAWTEATVLDVDGDGHLDVAAHGTTDDRIDVLLGTPWPLLYDDATLATPGPVRLMRVGDFDGNGVDDLAFATGRAGSTESDDLLVSYGRLGQPPAQPTHVGRVGNVLGMGQATILIPGRYDAVDDLVVAGERAGVRGLAVVLGSTSQRMIAPLIPVGAEDTLNLVEALVSLRLDQNQTADVVCLIVSVTHDPDGEAVIDVSSRVRVYTSSADGVLTEVTTDGGAEVPDNMLTLNGAVWDAIEPAGGAPGIVVGADVAGRVIAIPVACADGGCTPGTITDLTGGDRPGRARSLRTADLDGDGDLDVVGTFDGAGLNGPGQLRVWINQNGNLGTSQRIDAPAGITFIDSTAVDLDLDGTSELILVGRSDAVSRAGDEAGALYRSAAAAGGSYGTPQELATGVELDDAIGLRVVGGDLDGDGLADLVLMSGVTTPTNLKVLRQQEALVSTIVENLP